MKRFLAVFLMFFVATTAFCQPTKPYNFSTNDPVSSAKINSNYDVIYQWCKELATATMTLYSKTLYSSADTSSPYWHKNNDGAGSGLDADAVDGLHPPVFFNNMGAQHAATADFNNVTDFGFRYLQGATNGPGIPGATQYYGLNLGLGSQYPFSQYNSQLYWPRSGSGGLPYISVRFKENSVWSAWSKIYAGYADSAGNADTLDGSHLSSLVNTTYNSSLNSDSRNSRGVTRLYRRDSDYDHSVQTYYTGSRWRLYGYSGDTPHADTHVGYADSAANSDTLDGSHASAFAGATHNHDASNIDAGTLAAARLPSTMNSTVFEKVAHSAGANDRHLEIYAPQGTVAGEVSLRFHQGGRWYQQIRNAGAGFRFTQGSTNDLVPIFASSYSGFAMATPSTVSTIPLRDANADIETRLFKSTYAEQTTAAAATADIAFRNSTTDNYIRFMSNAAFKQWLINAACGVVQTSAPASPVNGDIWTE